MTSYINYINYDVKADWQNARERGNAVPRKERKVQGRKTNPKPQNWKIGHIRKDKHLLYYLYTTRWGGHQTKELHYNISSLFISLTQHYINFETSKLRGLVSAALSLSCLCLATALPLPLYLPFWFCSTSVESIVESLVSRYEKHFGPSRQPDEINALDEMNDYCRERTPFASCWWYPWADEDIRSYRGDCSKVVGKLLVESSKLPSM